MPKFNRTASWKLRLTSNESALTRAREQVAESNTVSLRFSRFASMAALVGHPFMPLLAVVALIVWAASGPIFHFSDTWPLVINTGTTIVTFLVVFLIQNTQNRDAKALHLKLDELIRSHIPARNDMIDIEKTRGWTNSKSDMPRFAPSTRLSRKLPEFESQLSKKIGSRGFGASTIARASLRFAI